MQDIGLYIHIPFCDGKCNYCSFFSVYQSEAALDEYTDNLKRIIALRSEETKRRIATVYFGGGTPSLLGHSRLIDILDTVKACFDIRPDAEVTVEVNPSSAASLDFAALKSSGFNRLSIGMQSVHDSELELLGRRHRAKDVDFTVEAARAAGFDNISLDVMLAIPGQTEDSLLSTLEYCADTGVEHVSAYILKVEEGTRFYNDRASYRFFDDDEQAAFYELAVRRMAELGYKQYEVSNFSLPGYESRHNMIYWHDEEYLGIGPSAHSFIDGKRFFYPSSFKSFYEDKTEYEGPGGEKEEYIMLALRLSEGLVFDRCRERFGEPLSESFMKAAEEMQTNGLANLSASSLSLTVKGFLVSNSVIAYLIERL